MIAGLRGEIVRSDEESVTLDVHGVLYLVRCTPGTQERLQAQAQGGPAEIVTRMIVREDEVSLYGFASTEEERLFGWLLSVTGVGPKVALALLGRFPARELALAIASGDTARLSQAAGVGKKLAGRIALELRDRLQPQAAAGQTGGAGDGDEAMLALLALGLPERTAQALLDGTEGTVEERVRLALQKIGGRQR